MVRGCLLLPPRVLPTGRLWVHVVVLCQAAPRLFDALPSPTQSAAWFLRLPIPAMAGPWLVVEGVPWLQLVLADVLCVADAPPLAGHLVTRRLLIGLVHLWMCIRRTRGVHRLHRRGLALRLAVQGRERACSVTGGRTPPPAMLYT